MWKPAWALLVVLATTIAAAPAQESVINAHNPSQIDEEHTRWIDQVMRSISTIKPGMTRKDLASVLTWEGGFSTRTQRRYVYRHCPYIKVDVQFSPAADMDANQDAATENPEDRIVKISRPYLEYSIMD
jgi:hypothetical protein